MSVYKHCVSMRCDSRQIIEDLGDRVVVLEHLTPDPNGPYLVMSDYAEPTFAGRKVVEMKDAVNREVPHE